MLSLDRAADPPSRRSTAVLLRASDARGRARHARQAPLRDTPSGRKVARLVEVEAYLGGDDPASHAYPGERGRNRPMFGEVGHSYVYVSYGVHHCMNVVARSAGRPSGDVLLRGAVPLEGFAGEHR